MSRLRTIIILLGILSASAANAQNDSGIISKDSLSITFVVDENLSLPDKHFTYSYDVNHIYVSSLDYCGVDYESEFSLDKGFSSKDHRLLQSCFTGENIYGASHQVMFSMFIEAYAKHRPIVLSPDAIWLLISQSFSYHVNTNSEELRSKFVDHEGKSKLSIQSSMDLLSEDADWGAILDMFSAEIAACSKGDIAETLIAAFSTTGETERMVSQITLMNAMESYFEYMAIWAVCGIPSITLTGTPKDWKEVLFKTQRLKGYGLDWWISKLTPILKQFIKAAEGAPDQKFWQDIVRTKKPGEVRGASCSRRAKKSTKYDGWFLNFFPFDKNGRTPSKVKMYHQMLPEVVRVEFLYKIVNAEGEVLSEHPMEMIAGFVGYEEDMETYALTPVIGWMIGTYCKTDKRINL